jgi:hypothetical protein
LLSDPDQGQSNESTRPNDDVKIKQMSNLLDFATMAEGFENLMASKKTDSQLIQAVNETT